MKHSAPTAAARLKFVFCGAVALLLTACGGSQRTCTDPDEPYLTAREHDPLRVPQGMKAPNRSDSLAIPAARTAASAKSGRASCLDEPPSYFRSAGTVARSPEEVVANWAQAWANREADAVLSLYSAGFKAPTDASGSADWLEQRREQVATGPAPDPMLESISVEQDGQDRRTVKFVQKFGANALRKELTLVRESGSWRIAEEQVAGVK